MFKDTFWDNFWYNFSTRELQVETFLNTPKMIWVRFGDSSKVPIELLPWPCDWRGSFTMVCTKKPSWARNSELRRPLLFTG